MTAEEDIGEMICRYMGCTTEPISLICAHKDGEESIYKPACGPHESVIAQDMKDLYGALGYIITIVDVTEWMDQ